MLLWDPYNPFTEHLSKLKYDGTVEPCLYSTAKSKEGQQLQIPKQKKYHEILWLSTRKYC